MVAAGYRKGRSLLMEEDALEWLIGNCNIASTSTRRHVELALCHLAQNGKQSSGIEISMHLQHFDSDIYSKTLNSVILRKCVLDALH